MIDDLIDKQDISDETIDDRTKKIFSNVIDIHNKSVEDVMVPRADIIAVSETVSLQQLSVIVGKSKHSRIPTFLDNLDKITGMVHIRDLFDSVKSSATESTQVIPLWVKNNADWWAQGEIDDNSFVKGIEFLVKVGVIQVN